METSHCDILVVRSTSGMLLILPSDNVSDIFQSDVTRTSSNILYVPGILVFLQIFLVVQMAACLVDIIRIPKNARHGRECFQYPHVLCSAR